MVRHGIRGINVALTDHGAMAAAAHGHVGVDFIEVRFP
jgi:hypothetical protein